MLIKTNKLNLMLIKTNANKQMLIKTNKTVEHAGRDFPPFVGISNGFRTDHPMLPSPLTLPP